MINEAIAAIVNIYSTWVSLPPSSFTYPTINGTNDKHMFCILAATPYAVPMAQIYTYTYTYGHVLSVIGDGQGSYDR
jgi:hypothetical protein